jgi:hypothetical protein
MVCCIDFFLFYVGTKPVQAFVKLPFVKLPTQIALDLNLDSLNSSIC